MNEARPFLNVKDEGINALPVPAVSARSDYEPDHRSTWEYALDADRLDYRKVHATLPTASMGKVALPPQALHAASQRNWGSLFSAARCLSDPNRQIDQSRSNSPFLAMRDFSTQWTDKRNGAIRRRKEIVNILSTCSVFLWPDHSRIVQMWARTTKADSRECVSSAIRRAH